MNLKDIFKIKNWQIRLKIDLYACIIEYTHEVILSKPNLNKHHYCSNYRVKPNGDRESPL